MSAAELQRSIRALLPSLTEADTAVLVTHLPRLYERLEHLRSVFEPEVLHCVAIKSHPHIELLRIICSRGFGLEAASIEEVRRALQAGCPSERLVFDSPVKTRRELLEVARLPGTLVNVNSLSELKRIPKDALCTIGIRINPQTHTGSPELFSVGQNESKFGVPLSAREALFEAVRAYPVRALHMHSGSQMRDLDAQRSALEALGQLASELNLMLKTRGLTRRIEIIDIGGGLPTEALEGETQMSAYAALVHGVESLSAFQLVTEFGQWVNTEPGFALSRIEYRVSGDPPKLFTHLGADMFMRDAYTRARTFPLSLWSPEGELIQRPPERYDIAGPLCFAGDYLARDVVLPKAEEGQWLCIDHTGANCYALWSRHCSRDVPAVWAWSGEQLIRWSDRSPIQF